MEGVMTKVPALQKTIQLGIILGCFMLPLNAFSATLNSSVKDSSGKPVKDAVVYANPLNFTPASSERLQNVIMDEIGTEFVPYVLPVQTGTPVHFPNKDNISHNVYSISPAKKFELPLYKGTPAPPVVFDKPGPVVLGCSIHDLMIAYIYVVETPYFAKTGEDGSAEIANLPAGQYEVLVWHPLLMGPPESIGKHIDLSKQDKASVDFVINMMQAWRPPRNQIYRY